MIVGMYRLNNVSGLDTVKYDKTDFEARAANAIDIAIEKTSQDMADLTTPDQVSQLFLQGGNSRFDGKNRILCANETLYIEGRTAPCGCSCL